MPYDLPTLRALFRALQQFRALYESEGIDEVTGPAGESWSWFDVRYLYEVGLPMVPKRQHQAIELCLIQNYTETEAARIMGLSPTNPVSMYANDGLRRLLKLIAEGALPRLRAEPPPVVGWTPPGGAVVIIISDGPRTVIHVVAATSSRQIIPSRTVSIARLPRTPVAVAVLSA